ncbi:MAG: alpha/beta hydrolase [Pseudomonadota bacterium]
MSETSDSDPTPKVTRMAPGEAYEVDIDAHQGWAMAEHPPSAGPARKTDLLFLHGMSSGGWMWSPEWLQSFTRAGYRCWTLTLPGRQGGPSIASDPSVVDRALSIAFHQGDPERALDLLLKSTPGISLFDGPGISDYTDALAEALARIGRPTVAICHSLGGAVAQNLMRRGESPVGTILLCSAPPYGLWRASMEMAFTDPDLWQTLADFSLLGLRGTNQTILRHALFPSGISDTDYAEMAANLRDESFKAMAQASGLLPFAPFPGPRSDVLVIGGTKDRFVPWLDVMLTGIYYGTTPVMVEGGGHMLMSEPCWTEAADAIMKWLPSLTDARRAA